MLGHQQYQYEGTEKLADRICHGFCKEIILRNASEDVQYFTSNRLMARTNIKYKDSILVVGKQTRGHYD